MSTASPEPEGAASPAERTSLAWSRTLVGLGAVIGFIATHADLGDAATALIVALGVTALAVLAGSSLVAHRRLRHASAALLGQRPATAPVAVAAMTGAAVVVALACMLLVFGNGG